jgi:hypothetical protein
MTQQAQIGPDGQQVKDDFGLPQMIPILELIFIDQMKGDIIVVPLTPEGVEAVKHAINPSPVIVPPPGTKV